MRSRGRAPKGGDCLIDYDKEPVSENRGILRLFKKECQKNKQLKEEINDYISAKYYRYNLDITDFFELF